MSLSRKRFYWLVAGIAQPALVYLSRMSIGRVCKRKLERKRVVYRAIGNTSALDKNADKQDLPVTSPSEFISSNCAEGKSGREAIFANISLLMPHRKL